MLRTRIRRLGSGLAALALVVGGAGAIVGASLATATTAGAAPAPGKYSCTITNKSTSATVSFSTRTLATSEVPIGPLAMTGAGQTIGVKCSGLTPSTTYAMIQGSGLADLATPASEQSFVDIGGGNLSAKSNSHGTLTTKIKTTFTNTTPNVTCPTSTVGANLGALYCFVTVATEVTETPLFLLDLAYTGNASPTATDIAVTKYVVNPASTTTPLNVTTTHGYWWGASEEGTQGVNPSSPIPDPAVLITGTPITSAGSGGASTLAVSPAAYAYGSTTTGWVTGTPTYPVMSGGLTIPSGLTPGVHDLTVAEGTLEGGQITASTQFYVPGASPTTVVGPAGTVGPSTGFTVTSKGWAPDTTTTWKATWVPPAGCNGTAPVTATSFLANPSKPTGTGDETFSFNTSDLSGLFSTASCVPGQWHVHVVQQVSDPITLMTISVPVTLVNLAQTCSITGTGTCVVQQNIGQTVTGTKLTVTEYAATTGIGAPGQNPTAIQVNLSKVTLGPGVFQAGQGMLNTVEVNDSRGTLSGWTVTGILQHDFQGPTVGNDHTIPADYLTWNPSVSLTYPGNLATGVVPNGTVSPPVYGPDSCPAGAASGGTNSNIKCPSANDNAGASNPAGKTNRTTSSNHANDTDWPSASAEGPSGLLTEVKAGPIANLGTATTGEADYGAQPAQVLCEAPAGGGGGAFNCDASLSLAVPPYVAAGEYSATMDILTVAT